MADGSTRLFPTSLVDDNATNRESSPSRNENDNTDTEKEKDDGAGDDGEEKDGPPPPVGFWDPSLAHVRKEAISKWLLTTVVLMLFILSVLSIYWACLYHVEQNLSSLTIAVVDFDGQAPYNTNTPIVGPTVTRLAQEQIQPGSPHLGYEVLDPSLFDNDPMAVRQAIYDFRYWAGIIINSNATAMLYSAIETGNSSYDPMGACQLVYMDARDDTNWYDFIYPILSVFQTQVTSEVGTTWARTATQLAASNATVLANLATVPQALSPAIGFSTYNLRPFYPYQSIPAVSIGLICHPPLKFYQLIIWRWSATIVAYFFLSLAYSLLSLAFQINFSGINPMPSETLPTMIMNGNPDSYGRATFVVYWMLNYVGMIALGLACENMAMWLGQPWTGLWLIFWVITNVATAFYDIDIEPRFYYWGYAWPLHNIVEGSRSILFDLHSRIGLNFGILAAWVAVNTAFFPVSCYFMRYKSKKGLHEYWA